MRTSLASISKCSGG